uniref:Uncharacterized protein n=1 Tax=Populus trichocarpa TaxID=3694 RepID=A0A2K2B2R1_POPTR
MPSINGIPRNAPKTAFPDLKKLFQLTLAPLTKSQFQTSFIFTLRLILFYIKNNAVLCDSNPVSTTSIQGMICLLFMYLRHKFAALNQGMPQMVRCLDYFCQLKKESACSPLP